MVGSKKRTPELHRSVPQDPNTINTKDPAEMNYWKAKLRIGGWALAGAIRAVGNRSVKDVTEYLEAEAAYRKLLQYRATGRRVPPALAAKAERKLHRGSWRSASAAAAARGKGRAMNKPSKPKVEKKRVPQDPNIINTKDLEELAYWRERLGVSGNRIASAIRVVRSRSLKDVTRYLKEEEAYRKMQQRLALSGQPSGRATRLHERARSDAGRGRTR